MTSKHDPPPPSTEGRPRRRRHDATFTRLYTNVVIIREFVLHHLGCWIVPELVDLASLRRLPEQFVKQDGEQRRLDVAWIARYGDEGHRLICTIEFQSDTHSKMADRVREYGEGVLTDMVRGGDLDVQSRPPHGIAVVIYNGKKPWNPKGAAGLEGPPPGPKGLPSRSYPWWRFCLVDLRRFPLEHAKKNTLLAALALAEADPNDETMSALQDAALKLHPDEAGLYDDVMLWIQEAGGGWGVDQRTLEEPTRLEEVGPVIAGVADAKARAVAQGEAKARAEDVARVARWKWSPDEERLAALLDVTNGAAGRTELIDAVLDSETFEEFEAEVRRLIDASHHC